MNTFLCSNLRFLWIDIQFLGLDTHLFVKVPRPGDSEGSFLVRVELPPVTTSLTTKGRAIPLSALPQDTTSELAGLSSHYPLFAEREAGKLRMLT